MKVAKLFLWCFVLSRALVSAQEVAEAEAAMTDAQEQVPVDETTVAEDATATTTAVEEEDTLPDDAVTDETAVPQQEEQELPVQSGPFVDLFGPTLLSLEMTSPTTAQLNEMLTNDALQGKKIVGLYFSADWCGPCRKFTPELVQFYDKVNQRRRNDWEIVWISRCRDVQSYGQYFTEMKWLALPPQEAMGERGQWLGEKFGVKSIPHLVLLDDVGNVITKDARNQIPKDKAGIGFPWRNPLSTFYITVVPRALRHMIKSNVANVKDQVMKRILTVLRPTKKAAA